MMPTSPRVQLRSWWALSEPERAQVLALQIAPEQTEFAGTMARAIDKLGPTPSTEAAALAVYVDGVPAAFLAVSCGSRAAAWAQPGAAVVSGMRVDRRHQGQGIGSAALVALRGWLRQQWPQCTVMELQVDAGNQRGIRAYARAGFTPVGAPQQGRIGWVLRMAQPLDVPAAGAAAGPA